MLSAPVLSAFRVTRLVCFTLMVISLSGCAIEQTMADQIYRPDLQQGNVIDDTAVAQIKPGMAREQVRLILGSPLLESIFRHERWDYVYWFVPGKDSNSPEQLRQAQRVVIYFNRQGQVEHLENLPFTPPKI